MKKFIPVFKAGNYPQGSYSDSDVEAMFRNYDPDWLSAPFSTDHKKDGPALGYARTLKFENGTLFAATEDINPALQKAIKEKNYGRVSIEVFRSLPEKGPYLKAISFLGVKVPAVKGLEGEIQQAGFEDEPSEELEFSVDFTENTLDFAKGEAGDGTGPDVRKEIEKLREAGMTLAEIGSQVDRSASTLQAIISGDIANPPESLLSALRKVTPPKKDDDENDDPAAGDVTTFEERIAKLEAEKAELDKKFQATEAERQQAEQRLEEIEVGQRKLEFEGWLNARIAFGSVPPATKDKIMELLLALESVEMFSGDGEPKDPVKLFQELIESLPQLIDGEEFVKKPDGPAEFSGSEELAEAAKAYKKKLFEDTGRTISTAEAVHRVQNEPQS